MTKREKKKLIKNNKRNLYLAAWETEKNRGMSLSAFCRTYGLSRKTFYRWLGKEIKAKTINRVNPILKAKAIEIYLRYKGTWCAETISMTLKGMLSASTIRKLVAPYKQMMNFKIPQTKHETYILGTAAVPNEVWSVDWTEYKIRGKKFFILFFMDEASRFYLGWYIFTATPTGEDVAFCLKDIFVRYESRPLIIKSDRAKVFSCAQWITLLQENDIEPYRIRPHCPQDQGVIERGMREVKTWVRANAPKNLIELDICLNEGMFMLNFLKPKIVLNGDVPAAVYFNKTAKIISHISEDLCLAK
ncbi:MAG: DDE-type integrase/transposase/recombinase [Elusimicrobia bacterium]|nr:DDE-type integrase/transposase/recombinase [Elusimicrobiota bacterium]